MKLFSLAANAAIVTVALAIIALAALHLLKPEVSPSRNMISQYALGRHGWVMTLFFGALAAASASLFGGLIVHAQSFLGRIGLAFLLAAAIGLAMAARFPMDPAGTPRDQMSLSGKMHGLRFLPECLANSSPCCFSRWNCTAEHPTHRCRFSL